MIAIAVFSFSSKRQEYAICDYEICWTLLMGVSSKNILFEIIKRVSNVTQKSHSNYFIDFNFIKTNKLFHNSIASIKLFIMYYNLLHIYKLLLLLLRERMDI